MAEVHRVFDHELNRTLARKTLHSNLWQHSGAVGRFVDEAQATAQLTHPNIIPIHDIGRDPTGRVWFCRGARVQIHLFPENKYK
jgi:serine/threonine-protein kinase